MFKFINKFESDGKDFYIVRTKGGVSILTEWEYRKVWGNYHRNKWVKEWFCWEGIVMFKVYCRSKAHKQWTEYSQPFMELDNAVKCKEKAEKRKVCDIFGNLIEYKVMVMKR